MVSLKWWAIYGLWQGVEIIGYSSLLSNLNSLHVKRGGTPASDTEALVYILGGTGAVIFKIVPQVGLTAAQMCSGSPAVCTKANPDTL